LKVPKIVAVAKPIVKRSLRVSNPADLTKKDWFNASLEKKSPKDKKEAAKTGELKAPTLKPAKDTTPWVGIGFHDQQLCPSTANGDTSSSPVDGSGTAFRTRSMWMVRGWNNGGDEQTRQAEI
jgi:hypothetical protein